MGVLQPTVTTIRMQTTAMSRYNDTPTVRSHSIRDSVQRVIKENILRKKPKPQRPLIPWTSNNVFHDQALMQLVSTYESLQLGDSKEAVLMIKSTGTRIFGSAFDNALQDRVRRPS